MQLIPPIYGRKCRTLVNAEKARGVEDMNGRNDVTESSWLTGDGRRIEVEVMYGNLRAVYLR